MPAPQHAEEVADGPDRLWMEPGDVAELTFDTGETIRALWTRPRGTHAGWVLTDGTRLRARPRTLAHIAIVYPPEHTATEEVTHDDERPADTDPDTDAEHRDRGACESPSSPTG